MNTGDDECYISLSLHQVTQHQGSSTFFIVLCSSLERAYTRHMEIKSKQKALWDLNCNLVLLNQSLCLFLILEGNIYYIFYF